jgi:microcompartment protein CcmK/EutM
LFDNVVNPDAEEDVVGVSKKMLETLIDDLAESKTASDEVAAEIGEIELVSTDDSTAPTETSAPIKHTDISVEEDNSHIKLAIVAVQNAFKQRIQQIMGAGGGLLVILESCTEADELLAEELSQTDLPVVAMAAHTLRSMQRLGVASPVLNAQVLMEAVVEEAIPPNPLFKSAVDKLQAAEILLQQQCTAGAMDLLAASMLARAAAMAGQTVVPSADQVSVWLYGELLPQQILTAEQGAAIVRVVALSQSHQVPEALLAVCLADARQLCSEAEAIEQ